MPKKILLLMSITSLLLYLGCENPATEEESKTTGTNLLSPITVTEIEGPGTINVKCLSNIYINDNIVGFAYYDDTNKDLKFARSTDNGTLWTIIPIDTTGDVGNYCELASDGDNIYIAYIDVSNNNCKFAKSTDKGVSWPTGYFKTIGTCGELGLGGYPSIYIQPSSLNLAISYYRFYSSADDNLAFSTSDDGGGTWTSPAAIPDNASSTNYGSYSNIYRSGSTLFACYYDTENYTVRIVRSLNTGTAWTNIANLGPISGSFIHPIDNSHKMIVSGTDIFIYYNYVAQNKYMVLKLSDNGDTTVGANNIFTTSDGVKDTGVSNINVFKYGTTFYFICNANWETADQANYDLRSWTSSDGYNWNAGSYKLVGSKNDHFGQQVQIKTDGTYLYSVFLSANSLMSNMIVFERARITDSSWPGITIP